MASIPPSYYHASAAILIANHGDFFNTHAWFRHLQNSALTACLPEGGDIIGISPAALNDSNGLANDYRRRQHRIREDSL
jgi:hypothetical protein